MLDDRVVDELLDVAEPEPDPAEGVEEQHVDPTLGGVLVDVDPLDHLHPIGERGEHGVQTGDHDLVVVRHADAMAGVGRGRHVESFVLNVLTHVSHPLGWMRRR